LRQNPTASAPPSIQTSGDILPTGEIIDLVAPESAAGELALVLWRGNRAVVRRRFEFAGRLYAPVLMDPVVSRAIRFAAGIRKCGSVRDLFQRLAEAIKLRSDQTERGVKMTVFWLLASWFADILTVPSVSVASVSPVLASSFLGLLQCFCRRGLRLAELNPGSLCTIPMHLQPTLLIDQTAINRRLGGILRASCSRGQYVPASGGLRNLHCAKAVFCADKALEPSFGGSMLSIALTPRDSSRGLLKEQQLDQLAKQYQPQLMYYRLRNYRRVRDCTFDVPTFTPDLRILARSLGAAVLGDKELTSDLVSLLSPQDADARARRGLLPESAIVTSALALLHGSRPIKMLVSQFAVLVNAALRANGEIIQYNAEEIGWILNRMGLFSRRMTGGRGLRLDREFSKLVHDLAKAYDVTMTPGSFPGCPDCPPPPQTTESEALAQVRQD
jgi:hypothetical protein